MATITESLEKILNDLESVGGIELSAVVSRQGLLMVSRESNNSISSEALAAMTATSYMSAASTTKRLSDQEPKSIVIETRNKHLITFAAGPEALIVVMVGNDGYLGLILNELKKAAEKVKNVI